MNEAIKSDLSFTHHIPNVCLLAISVLGFLKNLKVKYMISIYFYICIEKIENNYVFWTIIYMF